MQKMIVELDDEEQVYYEVEFVDMDHTLQWLQETAEKYKCQAALKHLEIARECINQKRQALFG